MIADRLLSNNKESKTSYAQDRVSEKPIRSIAKAFSWRVIGTLDTLVVSYFLSGELTLAASIASVDFVTKMILYFFHERAWNAIRWAR